MERGASMDRYELVKDIASGNFGVAKLMQDKRNEQIVDVKYIERGDKIDKNVERKIINHRSLSHPNIVLLKEVFLTPTHLALAMEYAAGEKLFDRISKSGHGRFSEDEAHFFFQQLISGVSYCHSMHISHLDLQLENMLLDGSRLKISCYPKSSLLHPRPLLASKAPEVSIGKEYDEKLADVWLCGIALDFMLVGAYPFHEKAPYRIPDCVRLTTECRDLLYKIFVADPAKRITILEIRNHPWFVKKLSANAAEVIVNNGYDEEGQSMDEIVRVIGEAKKRIPAR